MRRASEAALEASVAVQRYCLSGQTQHSPEALVRPPGLGPPTRPPTVYLAASFATITQRWLLDTSRRAIRNVGGRCFSPLHDVGPYMGDAVATYRSDSEGIRNADSLLLLLDESRTGPLVEAGIAAELGTPIVVLCEEPDNERFTMLRGAGASIHKDLATAIYRSIWSGMGAT